MKTLPYRVHQLLFGIEKIFELNNLISIMRIIFHIIHRQMKLILSVAWGQIKATLDQRFFFFISILSILHNI